jgi:hypothetical protein
MVETVDQAQIIEFSDKVHHAVQQMQSRMKPYVEMKQLSGDVFAYDGLGEVEAREVNSRNPKADFDDITHNRRKITRRRFVVNLPVDSRDVRGALQNIDSQYHIACAAAAVRRWDKVAIEAAFADVLTGRDFENTTTFAADGGLTVDATAGLTYEKLLEIQENFIDADVGLDQNEKLFLTISGGENTALMGETELTSGDFSRQMAVDKGRIVHAAGMDLIHFAANATTPILEVSGGERFLVAGSTRGLCVGMSKDMSITVTKREDLIETHQIQVVIELGAVRTEGALIQKVRVTA